MLDTRRAVILGFFILASLGLPLALSVFERRVAERERGIFWRFSPREKLFVFQGRYVLLKRYYGPFSSDFEMYNSTFKPRLKHE